MRKIFIDESNIIRKPVENLAINELCTELVRRGDYDFIARMYTHDKGLILGANESLIDVNLKECNERGYEVARRLSGGSLIITSPELTLCYSLFFKSNKFSFEKTYKSIVLPLAESLGKNFSVTGYYYMRYNNKPIAGHAITSQNKVTQFDGVVNLDSLDVELVKGLFHTREYYEGKENFIFMNGQTYNLKGKKTNFNVKESKLIRSEEEELGGIVGLKQAGITKKAFINKLYNLFSAELASIEYSIEEINNYTKIVNKRLNKGKKACLGHCFIDLIEPETALHIN